MDFRQRLIGMRGHSHGLGYLFLTDQQVLRIHTQTNDNDLIRSPKARLQY